MLVTGMAGVASPWPCMRWRMPVTSAWTTCPPSCCWTFCRSSRRVASGVAIAVDVRSGGLAAALVPPIFKQLRAPGCRSVRSSSTPTPRPCCAASPRRAAPTRCAKTATDDGLRPARRRGRRPPPHLARRHQLERELLAALRVESTVIDTTSCARRPAARLDGDIVSQAGGRPKLTLVFESFAFKHGVPSDADFVFDVRILPNPITTASCAHSRAATRRWRSSWPTSPRWA